MHLIFSYLKFIWQSKNHHGVHSPFVYHLVTKCFYDTTIYTDYQALSCYRKAVLNNKTVIDITDFGAGSRVFKSTKREVAQIAKTAGISNRRAKLLFRVVRYFEPKSVLEIGTSLGLATVAMRLGNKSANIFSLEGCSQTLNQCRLQLQKFNPNNIHLIHTEFGDYFKNQQPSATNYDLIYFDGNHSQQATLQYFEDLLPTITNHSVWIFDDIHWSTDMEATWEVIKKHPKVTVTIDTFYWGFVFFRFEQVKEHFVIRV